MTEAMIVSTLSTALVGGVGIALYLVGRSAWRWKELDAAGRALVALGLVDALLTVGEIERARELLAELPPASVKVGFAA